MAFPGPKVHRRNRRKLGRGQYPQAASVALTVTSTGTTNVTLTFAAPVVVSGRIMGTVATLTFVSQTVVSSTVVTQVWSAAVSGHAYNFPAAQETVATAQGGSNAAASGTF